MAEKAQLRRLRTNTVINATSKKQEKALTRAMIRVVNAIEAQYPSIELSWSQRWFLKDIVAELSSFAPDVEFQCKFNTSYMSPDGGVLSVIDTEKRDHVILISEKKNQGTNNLRALEGKPRQSKGNAIERLGKNVIGFRTAMMQESIFPFVCFGDGCDFAEDSSILDRVITIAMFGELNKIYLHDEGTGRKFDRGSFFFKVEEWLEDEMFDICMDIASRSILYYQSKYGAKTITR